MQEDKVDNVSTMVHGDKRPLAEIGAEIAKCRLLCVNCHRRRTAVDEKEYAHIDPALRALLKLDEPFISD